MRYPRLERRINAAKSVALRHMRDGWRLSLPDNSVSGSYWVHVKKLNDADLAALYDLLCDWAEWYNASDGGEDVHSDAGRDDPLGSKRRGHRGVAGGSP